MSLKLIPKLVWDKHLESAYKVHIQHVTYNKYDIELLCLARTHTHTHTSTWAKKTIELL